MSADSPRRNVRGVPSVVPPQIVSDRSIIDSVAGFINDVTLANQPLGDPKDTINWARFESAADISDPRFGDDWELEGNVAPPLLLILGYGLGIQVWAIPANGEAVEVLTWRHGIVSALRILPTPTNDESCRADDPIDLFADNRPLMAVCEGSGTSSNNPQFCSVNFVSLRYGEQLKTIKFKNPVLDILANRASVVITFHERIAVFDARTLEDRLTVTTCFPSPGINPNPVALGARWLAYSENKLLPSKRSGGGCDGDGVSSYTATVLNAAKSLGKGLRELGEQVAAGLTGVTPSNSMSSKSVSFDAVSGDIRQPGVVTILDIKHPVKDNSPTSGTPISINGNDPIVAHFIAHSEAIVAMEFDNSGMMMLTCDKRGHDFHMFRIQPHPVGSTLAAVHHLYVLHRGDTSAKVQNISFSLDSRWVAVSTLRGTTHVFPITPYGGAAGVRTHTSLHVVNKLSRFHRSAGLTADGRSSSPISHSDSTNFSQQLMPYHNPTMPPFPRPTVVQPLAQLRQPFTLGSPPGSAQNCYAKATVSSKDNRDRQRLSSLSDDNGKPLSVCAVFAKSRSWLLDAPNVTREGPAHKLQRKAVDSLFVMAGHGALIQYDLDTKLASNVAKEKICDDTAIELDVEAKAQWNLGRRDHSTELIPPLSNDNWLIKDRYSCMLSDSTRHLDDNDDRDSWLSQVEIITHAGPHRRLWMGPQFVFKTYNTPSGSNLSHIESEAVEIGVSSSSGGNCRPGRSSPLNMPLTAAGRSTVPVLIESGSYSSIEQSPKLMDRFRHDHMDSDFGVAHGESRLKEDLADAMRESPSVSHNKDTGLTPAQKSSSPSSLTSSSSSSSVATTVAKSASNSSKYESLESLASLGSASGGCGGINQNKKCISIEKVVNPLGTVTTVTSSPNDYEDDMDPNSPYGNFTADDYVIHENCDESLFRPVVAIFCDDKINLVNALSEEDMEFKKPPETISTKLIVPVIEKSVDIMLSKKELKQKNAAASARNAATAAAISAANEKISKELSLSNQKVKSSSSKSKINYDIEVSLGKETHDLETTSKQTRKGESKKLRKSEEKQTQVSDDVRSLNNSQLDRVFTSKKSSCKSSEEKQITIANDDFEKTIKIPVREYCATVVSPQLQATNDQDSNLSKSVEVNVISRDIEIYDELFLEPEEVPIKFERMTRNIKTDESVQKNKKDISYADQKNDKEFEGTFQSLGENININEIGVSKIAKSSSKKETALASLPIPAYRAFTAPHNKRVERNDSSDIEILEKSKVKDKKLKLNKTLDGSVTVLSKSDKSEYKYKNKIIEVDSEVLSIEEGEESAIGTKKKSSKKFQTRKESLSDLEIASASTSNLNPYSGDIKDKDEEFAWGSALTEDLKTIRTDNDYQDMFKTFEVDKLSIIKQKSPTPVTVTIKWPKRDKGNYDDKEQTERPDKVERTDKSKRLENEFNFKEKKLKKNKASEISLLSKSDKSELKYNFKSFKVDSEGFKADIDAVEVESKKNSSKKNIKEKLNDLENVDTVWGSADGSKTIKKDNEYQDIIKQFLVDKRTIQENSPNSKSATLPPLSPLKSFDNSKFNNCDADLDHDSLIIFESPQKEAIEEKTFDDKSVVKNKEGSAGKKLPFPGYTADNLIFALCGSLHYENEYTNKSEPGSPLTMSVSDATQLKDDYLSNKKIANDHDKKKYKNSDYSYQENVLSSSSISDEMEVSGESGGGGSENASLSYKKDKHRKQRKKVVENENTEDDEELRPLINSDANLASSMTVSIAKGDDDDDTLQSLINSATKSPQKKLNSVTATKIAKAITETLPLSLLDNILTSDSSSSDQFATSTPEEPEPDDNKLKSIPKDEQKKFESDEIVASDKAIINKGDEQISIHTPPVNSVTATVTATASTTAQLLLQPQQSQKKRLRRRKR